MKGGKIDRKATTQRSIFVENRSSRAGNRALSYQNKAIQHNDETDMQMVGKC